MPLITVSYTTPRQSPPLKADIASAVSELTAKILHKDPEVTAIIVKSVEASDWFAGGKSLAEQKLASYWIDIHVSEGTNTKDEKAAYLAAMFQRMAGILGPLHHETYLHVDEVKGRRLWLWRPDPGAALHRRQARGFAGEGVRREAAGE
ncbi:4-oxalocrotonate tautomerase [Bradyrhizobium sp. GM7.3]